ncbi:hypothetical protein ACFLZT_07645 [Thermodesulfobacteriota bacterium]
MPDLTLDEFRGFPKEKLDQILRDEAGKLNCSVHGMNNPPKKTKFSMRLFKQLKFYSQRLLRTT